MTPSPGNVIGVVAAGVVGVLLALAPVAPRAHAQEVETPDVLPAGKGRDETFYVCTACHGSAIVRQQGMTRQRWDDTITYMIAQKEMPELEVPLRDLILDYLAATFPPRPRGFQNPFLNP